MNALWQDIRYGFRILLKNPGFTAIAVFSLALGIGANTTIFSVIDAILLKALPYNDPDRIVLIWGDSRLTDDNRSQVSFTNSEDWRKQNHVFEELATYSDWTPILSGIGEAERVKSVLVSEGFFSVMKVKPLLGRSFLPEEQEEGKDLAAILGYGLWQRRFGGDRNVIGKTIHLNSRPYTIVGVMPESFHSLPSSLVDAPVELYRPVAEKHDDSQRSSMHLRAIARLKPGVSIRQAQAEMSTIAKRLELQHPEHNSGYGVRLISLADDTLGTLSKAILLVFGAVACVLLIACANVANLLLARTTARQKEVAIRLSIGAGRWQLIRQFLVESMLIATLAGLVGILIALWGNSLIASAGSSIFPLLIGVQMNLKVLGFTVFVSLLTGILFGIIPAFYASRSDLNDALKEEGRTSGASAHHRARSLLVVSEVALAVLLLICSGLMIRTILSLRGLNPGFSPDNVLTMNVWLPFEKYPDDPKRLAFFDNILDRIQSLAGVRSAGIVTILPLGGGFDGRGIEIDGVPFPVGQEPEVEFYTASPGYQQAMNIPLKKGRFFTRQDTAESQKVAVVSESFASKYWLGQDPIGKRVRMIGDRNENDPWFTVVGILNDVKQRGLDSTVRPQLYYPNTQFTTFAVTLVVRTLTEPGSLAAAVQKEIRNVDKDQAVFSVATMNQVLAESISLRSFLMLLLAIFAALAMILAAVGIYGVVSYSVVQRTHEIGIRMALGAAQMDVLKMVVKNGLILALVGIVIGTIAATGITRLMSNLLFGVSPNDPLTFVAIIVLLTAVAVLASYFPARRASQVDPMVALRYE